MQIIDDITTWRNLRATLTDKTIGFVPTMGHLHQGHLELLRRCHAENDITVLSIFVNPTQFNHAADFQNYPITLEKDYELAKTVHTDYVLLPSYQQLYPDNYQYRIVESSQQTLMEGRYRPGHFDGMLTVVMKLLLLAKAQRAYFGEKDYQQLQLVQGLARAFFIETEIIACPTVRNAQGLALSSRNSRLSATQLALAEKFPALLANAHLGDETVIQQLTANGFTVDYVETHAGRRFGAIHLGNVRLIDNVLLAPTKESKSC